MNEIYLMGMIADRDIQRKLSSFFKKLNIHVVYLTMASGTASSATLDYFGLEATEKLVCFSVLTMENWKLVRKGLYETLRIDIPGRGIAFLIPLSSVGRRRALQYLTAGQNLVIEEESTLKNTEYELLITVANAGYTEMVMDAARSANAPGGTVIHARGTGAEQAKRFLGILLAEEKEMIFIVVRSTQKNAIMKAIMDEAGVDTPAGSVVFSLPVTSTAGLRVIESEEE
ncbi:MAG: P-II family nitrogen regulator [Lachnospiraceae bacterium]|nr:P-II family nitrogen regulator [Lachnospiraceae bacterium]